MKSTIPIFGLAGSLASGKDTIAHFLVDKHGYYHVSTGDVVREIAQEKYGSIERPVLYKTANELRREHGSGALAKVALERFFKLPKDSAAGLVVSGLRSVGEAEALQAEGAHIIFVDAPIEVRYERMKNRARDNETLVSLDEFKQREADENGGVDPAFSIIDIKALADTVLLNEKTSEDLLASVEQEVAHILEA
jgi:dephospho-CoA kinase